MLEKSYSEHTASVCLGSQSAVELGTAAEAGAGRRKITEYALLIGQ